MTAIPRKNSETPRSLNLQQIAELVGGELIGESDVRITGVAGIKEAKEGDITFLSNPRYQAYLEETGASAVITSRDVTSGRKPLVRTGNPLQAFTKVLSFFIPPEEAAAPGVHASAVVDPSVEIGAGVSIGPTAVVERGVSIGACTVIGAGVYVGARARLGASCRVYPNVTIREGSEIGDRVILHSGAVIGSEGFGYETENGRHERIPHVGNVKIEDDVEIGANVCVDRGRFQSTWIRKGAKIDNLVQIAHNVVIGENCIVVSQAGISGSTELGANVVVAGQAGLVGHITVGDGAVIGARSGVTKSVPAGTIVLGQPAKPIAEQKKLFALMARLPDLFKDLSEIKKKLGLG